MAISFRAVIARPLIDSMTHPKFLTNFVWKQNGNILAKIRLRKRKPPSKLLKNWSHPPESNRRPTDYESVALPTELGWLRWVL